MKLALDRYEAQLEADGLSPKTVRLYVRMMTRFAEFLGSPSGTVTFEIDALRLFADTLPNSASTRSQLRAAASRVAGAPKLAVLRVPTAAPMVCRALPPDQACALAHVALSRRDARGLAVLCGLWLALRRSEIAGLHYGSFSRDATGRRWVRVVGKGNVSAAVPVGRALDEALGGGDGWVFPSRGAHVVPATIWEWVGQVGSEAGIPHLTPHVLRHTALATANDVTGDLRATQAFARHADPSTTAGYTRASTRRLCAVVDAAEAGAA